MKRLSLILILIVLTGCGLHKESLNPESDTGLGIDPFSTGGQFTADDGNAINNGVIDNHNRIALLEALTGIVYYSSGVPYAIGKVQADCSSETSGACTDSDNNRLYHYNAGTSVMDEIYAYYTVGADTVYGATSDGVPAALTIDDDLSSVEANQLAYSTAIEAYVNAAAGGRNTSPQTSEPTHSAGKVWVADADTWNPCASDATTDYAVLDIGTAFLPIQNVDGTPIVMTAEPGTGAASTCVAAWGWYYWADANGTWDFDTEVTGTDPYQGYYNGTTFVTVKTKAGELLLSTFTIPNTSSGDQALTSAMAGLKTDEDLFAIHGGAAGEVQDEAGLSLLDPFIIPFDPETEYDTTSNHVITIHKLGDAEPHGLTLVEWSCEYVDGDPTTELDMDLLCDTTPDWAPAAGATVMDVLDTTAGTSSADTGFDSATCANGSNMYLRFGADPIDSGERVHCEFLFYRNED